jgi:hypothetical protein
MGSPKGEGTRDGNPKILEKAATKYHSWVKQVTRSGIISAEIEGNVQQLENQPSL